MWGDVHFSLEETVETEVTSNKTTQATIYDEAIIPDLEFAIANLPNPQSQYGRATKPAAQYFLGQAILTRGYQQFGRQVILKRRGQFLHVISDYIFALVASLA